MSRIAARFEALARERRGALITFLEAYDPDLATSQAILDGMPAAGADLIEIGCPFTDPMADGPTIQRAAIRGLAAGATMRNTLAMVTSFRRHDDATPIVLMGYLNPILAYEVEPFCADAAAAGVDGLIVVDLPTEELALLLPHAAAHGLDIIRLVAPTTDDARLPIVLTGAGGFVYYVSISGITGTRTASSADLQAAIPRLRRATDLPIAVGFGVRTPEQARAATQHADAAVVASALIDTLAASLDADGRATAETAPAVLAQVRALADGLRAPPPAEPENVTPAEPENVTPAEPENVTPAEPESVTPAEPESVTPTEPESVTPAEPESVTPTEPENATPAEPEIVTQAQPETV